MGQIKNIKLHIVTDIKVVVRSENAHAMIVSAKQLFSNEFPSSDMFLCMSTSLRKYYQTGKMCDVIIKSSRDDVTLCAHKLSLAASSPFFHHALVGPLSTN